MTKRIAIIANCQARPVAGILRHILRDSFEFDIIISHLAQPSDEPAHTRMFASADFILSQLVNDTNPTAHIRSSRLMEAYPGRVITWPNVFFGGQCPTLCYITLKGGGRLVGPLGPYHDRRIFEAWSSGAPAETCLKQLHATHEVDVRSYAEKALKPLKKRELKLDIGISDFISRQWTRRRLFFTFNHPSSFLLVELGRRLARHLDQETDRRLLPEVLGEPLGAIVPPFSAVKEMKDGRVCAIGEFSRGSGMTIAKDGQIAFAGTRVYALNQVVELAYRAYDVQKVDASLVRFTPSADAVAPDDID